MGDRATLVCDAGPLIALALIDRLELLQDLFHKVVVPLPVFSEIVHSGAGKVGASEVRSATWLVRAPVPEPQDRLLSTELGSGEAAVIGLALQTPGCRVLIDERRARRIAEQAFDLPVLGSAGVLVKARRQGLLPEVRPLLESMVAQGYFLSSRLVERACQEVGEGK